MTTHVSTVKNQTNVYTYEQFKELQKNGQIEENSIKSASIFKQSADANQCTDGKDDGKIGFFEGVKSTVKGAAKGLINGIKGMFTDENGKFSLGKTLKTVAVTAACFAPIVGPYIAAGLCAYGAVKGGVGIAKGVASAANATTDAEKKAAFESIGGNALTTGISVVGLKASASAIAGQSGFTGVLGKGNTIAQSFKTNGIGSTLKQLATPAKNYYGSAWKTGTAAAEEAGTNTLAGGFKSVAKTTLKDTGKNVLNAAETVRNKTKGMTDKLKSNKSVAPENKVAAENIGVEESGLSEVSQAAENIGVEESGLSEVSEAAKSTPKQSKINEKVGKLKQSAKRIYNDSINKGYTGLPENGNIFRTAYTTASANTTNGTNWDDKINNASQTMVEIDSESGVEYDLEDYKTLTGDDVNNISQNIMKDVNEISNPAA